MRVILFLLAVLFGTTALGEPSGKAYYMHLEGSLTSEPEQSVIKELEQTFMSELRPHRGDVLFSQVSLRLRSGTVVFSLVVEPQTPKGLQVLDTYLQKHEGSEFYGLPVRFHSVQGFYQTLHLQTGLKKDGPAHDPFEPVHELKRRFYVPSLADWLKLSDKIGISFRAEPSGFMELMRFFAKTPRFYETLKSKYLGTATYVRLENMSSIILENGRVTEPGWGESPFLRWYYNRDCTLPAHGGGYCFQP